MERKPAASFRSDVRAALHKAGVHMRPHGAPRVVLEGALEKEMKESVILTGNSTKECLRDTASVLPALFYFTQNLTNFVFTVGNSEMEGCSCTFNAI